MRGPVDPSLFTTRRAFGVAGGPEEIVLTAAGSERAFSVGAQVKSGAPAKALEALAARGGTAVLTEKRGSRHHLTQMGRDFDQITWGHLREKGYVESFYAEGEDGVRLTPAGKRAVERGHEERSSLLERVRRNHPLRDNPRAAAGEPTDLNLYVLDQVIAKGGGVVGLLEATDVPHVRRCLKAGLLEPAADRGQWKLSPKGEEYLAEWRAKNLRDNPQPWARVFG